MTTSSEEPAPHVHRYPATTTWRGSTGVGYDAYDRGHAVSTPEAAATLELSSDRAFRGDPARWNPEQLLVAAASSCQLLSFLAVAARARVDVVDYADDAEGEMVDGPMPMSITRIVLRPVVTIAVDAGADRDAVEAKVRRLVDLAHHECY